MSIHLTLLPKLASAQTTIARLSAITRSMARPAMLQQALKSDSGLPTPLLRLRDGNHIPLLAFGTGTAWFKEPDDTHFDAGLVTMTKQALAAGFRHLDCAEMYNNEAEVGKAIKESGIPRDQLFITTKVADGITDIPAAVEESLRKLQTDYVDLYLIHQPWDLHSDLDYHKAWKGMESVKSSGKAKSIGVSNFVRRDMEIILNGTADPPVINQLEYHPYIQRINNGEYYIPWMQDQGIHVEAFKGLSALVRSPDGPLIGPLKRMSEAHKKPESAIMLRWLIQQNVVAVTTTTSNDRLREYAQALDFNLSQIEMDEIFKLGKTYWKRFYFPERYADDDRS